MNRPLLRAGAPRLLALAVCAFALSGCISLLPKSKPSQLYSFVPTPGAAHSPASPRAVGVFRTNGSFQNESADDRLLTITSGKNAYIAQTRWVAPAAVLFDQAVSQAFDASPILLIARGQQGRSAYGLRLDVRNFETRYDSGRGAPTVVVRVHAALNKADQSLVGEQIFEAKAAASDNRVSAIVVAYGKAMDEVIKDIVAWTEKSAT